MGLKSGKNLIFIENADQVIFFKKYFEKKDFANDYDVIVIDPASEVVLADMGIPFLKSDYFFKNDDHLTVIKKADQIINIMRSGFSLSDSLGVCHAYEREFFSFFRYYYLNYCLSLFLIIHHSISYSNPRKIIFPAPTHPRELEKHVTPCTSLIGYLGQLYGVHHGYNVVLEGQIEKSGGSRQWGSTLWAKALFQRLLFNIQLFSYSFLSKKKNVIFATNTAYNVPRVLENVTRYINNPFTVGGSRLSGLRLLFSVLLGKEGHFFNFPPPASNNDLRKFLNNYDESVCSILPKIDKRPDVFSIHGVCLRKLVTDYLENGLKNQIKITFLGSRAFDRILNIKRPAFLLSNQASGYHYAIGEQCRKHNITAMLVSHGTHVSHKEEWVKTEWDAHARFMIATHFPFVAVQSPWAKQFLDDQSNLLSTPIVTGPLLYSMPRSVSEKVKSRKHLFPLNDHKKIILHAASPFAWYVFHPFVNLTQHEYVTHINDVIKSVQKMSGVFLALRIRLKSFNGMSLADVKALFIKSDCYEIYTEGSFEDYLACADLLVSFSSTTIEEALQCRVPVLQYDPFDRYCHIPAFKLEESIEPEISSVYYISKYDGLYWGLEWIKNNHLKLENSHIQVDWSPHIIEFSEDWVKPMIEEFNVE